MFSRLSIRQKLTAMLMLISGVVLVLASAAFVIWDFYRFRADMQADLVTQARLVLDYTAAAITFNDPDAAGETLEMLEIHPHTQVACLYLPSGEAVCGRSSFRDRPIHVRRPRRRDSQLTSDRLFVTEQLRPWPRPGRVADDRRSISTRIARASARRRRPWRRSSLAGLLVSFLLSTLLQRDGREADRPPRVDRARHRRSRRLLHSRREPQPRRDRRPDADVQSHARRNPGVAARTRRPARSRAAGQSPERRVPRDAVARAAHAAQRDRRLGAPAAPRPAAAGGNEARPRAHRSERPRAGEAGPGSARCLPHHERQATARHSRDGSRHRGAECDRRLPAGRRCPAGRAGCALPRRFPDHGRSRSLAAGALEPDQQRRALHARKAGTRGVTCA